MIPLNRVQPLLHQYGYSAKYASTDLFHLFETDLEDSDKYELGRTHHQDWRMELYDTLKSNGSTFCVETSTHSGALIFGVTAFPRNAGRMWMLQSKSFASEARKTHGSTLALKMSSLTHAMIALFLEYHCPVFNFIPSNQARNIRWLKQSGFQFFQSPKYKTDILFFGQGEGTEALASDHQLWVSCLGMALRNQA